jgi:hypothetical protein
MKKNIPKEISEKYRLPRMLTDFQLSLYIHLIEWKWKHLTTTPGKHGGYFYDAILPKEFQDEIGRRGGRILNINYSYQTVNN